MDVSVIIVNYKTSGLIVDCIKSILKFTTDINYEVIIVDNNSEPDFEKKIREGASLNDKTNFHFLPLPENIGFGRANNEGLKYAQGRNIFFLNPDTVLLNNAIKILSDFLDNNPKAGACGGNLYDENLNPTNSFKRFLPGIFWETNELLNTLPQKILYRKNLYFNNGGNPIKVGYISGADLMVKKFILEKIGGFRKEYFLYFEETDLCFRIKKDGWSIFNLPSAKIQHLESRSFEPSTKWQSNSKTEYLEKSRSLYYSLNLNPLKRLISINLYKLFLNSRCILLPKGEKKNYYLLRKTSFNKTLNK